MAEDEKRENFTGLAKKLTRLSSEQKRAALEISAALAGVSLRVSRDFVEAVAKAAEILSADDLRHWGEMGRRLAMGNAEAGAKFFSDGVNDLKSVPVMARPLIFEICTRQLVLSSSISLETFNLIPTLSREVADDDLLTAILGLAVEIAQRSAKHSADFLRYSSAVANALAMYGDDKSVVAEAVVALASNFANRTGGMTADLWSNLPEALAKNKAADAVTLMERAGEFLEFGGSVTLHFVSAGSDVLASASGAFDDWCVVACEIAKSGNAVLISFLRATPKFFGQLFRLKRSVSVESIRRVLQLTARIAETDAESALAAFKSSASALKKVSVEQFEQWVENGIRTRAKDSTKARRS